MVYCYPSIILSIISIFHIYQVYQSYKYGLYNHMALISPLPFIVFAIISFVLCKKGYNKIAWVMILGAYICDIMFSVVVYSLLLPKLNQNSFWKKQDLENPAPKAAF